MPVLKVLIDSTSCFKTDSFSNLIFSASPNVALNFSLTENITRIMRLRNLAGFSVQIIPFGRDFVKFRCYTQIDSPNYEINLEVLISRISLCPN